MADTIRAWMLERVHDAATRSRWDRLPGDFQLKAVQHTFKVIKPHFDKRDIRARIAASRAQNFAELRYAVELMLWQ